MRGAGRDIDAHGNLLCSCPWLGAEATVIDASRLAQILTGQGILLRPRALGEDDLLVEADLTPADVAFVRAGQDVRINITAYDPSRYGRIDGRTLRVGADAVTRPDRDGQAFIVEIANLTRLTDAAGEAVEILPGMVVQVDILSGKRTVLDYLIAPVVLVKEAAFRE